MRCSSATRGRWAALATLGATPADRRLLAGGEMGATAIDSFLAAAAGGVDGMIDDYVACCTAWGFDLRDVRGEVHVWHGERDRFVPVEHARALAAALPRCRAQFDAQDGHFFFRRRVAEVLGRAACAAALSRRRPAPQRPRSRPEARRAGAGRGSSDGRRDR